MFRNRNRFIVIAIISATISGAAIIPNVISAQSSSSPKTSPVIASQNQKAEQNPLNLTDAQKQQFKSLNEKTSQLIQAVLTPEQRTTFAAELKKGDRNAAWKAINLTDVQKQKIREINQSAGEQSLAILTAEQRSQAEKNRKSLQNPLNLTDAQKQQFKTLNEKTSQLIQAVLTPEQQSTFVAELKKGDRSAAWRAITLTKEQREKIIAINKSASEERAKILTAEQRSQLEKRSAPVSSK